MATAWFRIMKQFDIGCGQNLVAWLLIGCDVTAIPAEASHSSVSWAIPDLDYDAFCEYFGRSFFLTKFGGEKRSNYLDLT
jgi:hypothetical protein